MIKEVISISITITNFISMFDISFITVFFLNDTNTKKN